jgi:hypothetical protein
MKVKEFHIRFKVSKEILKLIVDESLLWEPPMLKLTRHIHHEGFRLMPGPMNVRKIEPSDWEKYEFGDNSPWTTFQIDHFAYTEVQ